MVQDKISPLSLTIFLIFFFSPLALAASDQELKNSINSAKLILLMIFQMFVSCLILLLSLKAKKIQY